MLATSNPVDDHTLSRANSLRANGLYGAPSNESLGTFGNNALPLGTRLGEFEIRGLVAEGGFGIVYAAYDHSLQRGVALKEYMPSVLAMRVGAVNVSVKSARHAETFEAGLRSFINEARMLAQFDHPSLLKVYRFWEANGTAYMVMPHYAGVTLKTALQTGHVPDEPWLKQILVQLGEALGILHAHQCYHRDIAPDNIILLEDGRPVLLDFGAARRVIGDMTQALTVILKPGYAPLEQYADVAAFKQGPWTDVYALGAVVHFAITGRAPVPAVARMVSETLEPLAEVARGRYSDSFLRAIDRALAVRPDGRPQSVAELVGELGGTSDDVKPLHSERLDAAYKHARLASTRYLKAGVAAFALTAIVTATAWTLRPISLSESVVPRQDAPASNDAPPLAPSTVGIETEPANKSKSDSARTAVKSARSAPPDPARAPSAVTRRTPAPASPIAAPMSAASEALPLAHNASSESAVERDPKPQSAAPKTSPSQRCTEILLRLSLGETLPTGEQAYFQRECR